jgi:hypothetical protein
VTSAPEPLSAGDLANLGRWERNLRIAFSVGVGLVILWFFGLMAGDPPWQTPLAWLATAILVITGIAAQVAVRCPRCGRRIPFQSGFALPGRCAQCGVGFEASPGED